MASIITFYSYKGGVGRSMALANVAVLLARRGKKVLAVDWDLEAPGLPRYFSTLQLIREGPGLLPLLMQNGNKIGRSSYRAYLSIFKDTSSNKTLDVLASGQEADADYSTKLERFEWQQFFKLGGGNFIERLRGEWKSDYDVILIDSRTGLTDSGGICTIQLPDIVVAMFTANYQSMYGVRDVMRLAQKSRQRLSFDRMSLNIIPLPSRFGMRSEFNESKKWLDEFATAFAEFFFDWLPKGISIREVLNRIKVPQVDYFSFGERLAVVEDNSSNTEGMATPYNMLADVLASDLKNIQTILPPVSWKTAEYKNIPENPNASKFDAYDVYISYSHDQISTTWLRENFLPVFQEELGKHLGRDPVLFINFQELRLGEKWNLLLQDIISRSCICIALITPKYFQSEWCKHEFDWFVRRSEFPGGETRILPLVLSGSTFPESARMIQMVDFRPFSRVDVMRPSSRQFVDYILAISKLAERAYMMIRRAQNLPPLLEGETITREE